MDGGRCVGDIREADALGHSQACRGTGDNEMTRQRVDPLVNVGDMSCPHQKLHPEPGPLDHLSARERPSCYKE